MSDDSQNSEMVSITLVDFPVALASRAGKHYEAIQREFALIDFSDEGHASIAPGATARPCGTDSAPSSPMERSSSASR